MTLLPCFTDNVQLFCMPENDAASPIPLTSVLVIPGPDMVIRAHADASRSTMLTPCGLPFHMQPVVPSGMGETELPSAWAISWTVNRLQGSAAFAAAGRAANSPHAKNALQRRADEFTVNLLRVTDFSIEEDASGQTKSR